MNNKRLLRAMGNIRDDLVAEAVIEEKPKRAGRAWLALAACLCILLTGAAVFSLRPKDPSNFHLGGNTTPEVTAGPDAPSYSVITLDSLDQLAQMRQISASGDEVALQTYLDQLEGSDADSRQALLDFLELVDSIPVVQLMDGTICRLSHQKTPASQDTYENVLDLSFENQNGQQVRLEYLLSVEDIAAKEQEIQSVPGVTALDMDLQIEAAGDQLRVFGERRGQGNITWYLSVNGIYTQVTYRAADAVTVNTGQVFEGLSVIRISDLRA